MKKIILDLTEAKQVLEISEDTEIFGLFIGHGTEQIKGTLEIVHRKPDLKSLTLIKAVVYDQASFDLTGNLVIKKGAKLTDAYLRIDALMMSTESRARAVPSLEITENDVKGGHGATVGQVDQEQLFYLQSRGLNRNEAEEVLVEGFIADIKEKISGENVL